MQWNEGFEWAPFGVLWIKSLHCCMNDYNESLKHHRCRMCSYKDQEECVTMSGCFGDRIWLKSSFHLLRMLHFCTGIQQLSEYIMSTAYRRNTDLSSDASTVFVLFLIVSLSASQTVLKTEEVHSWGTIVFLLKILIKHHLFISVSIPNVDMFKFFFPVNTCKLCGRVISGE